MTKEEIQEKVQEMFGDYSCLVEFTNPVKIEDILLAKRGKFHVCILKRNGKLASKGYGDSWEQAYNHCRPLTELELYEYVTFCYKYTIAEKHELEKKYFVKFHFAPQWSKKEYVSV